MTPFIKEIALVLFLFSWTFICAVYSIYYTKGVIMQYTKCLNTTLVNIFSRIKVHSSMIQLLSSAMYKLPTSRTFLKTVKEIKTESVHAGNLSSLHVTYSVAINHDIKEAGWHSMSCKVIGLLAFHQDFNFVPKRQSCVGEQTTLLANNEKLILGLAVT